jgi:hypothetical protein
VGRLITVADLAREGIGTGQSEGRLEWLIDKAEQEIERLTGYKFYGHDATYTVDGSGSEVIVLPQPPLTLTSVSEGGTALDTSAYTLYTDRRYPRLVKSSVTGWAELGSLVDVALAQWAAVPQNVVLVGHWGYVDLVGSAAEVCPKEIQWAVIRLVRHLLPRVGADDEEMSRKLLRYGQDLTIGPVRAGMSPHAIGAITGDPDIDRIVLEYRHPLYAGAAVGLGFGGA